MNDVDPKGSEHKSETKKTPNNAEVYQHHKDGHNGGPQKQYTHNELYESIRTFWRGAVKGWKETEFHHRVEIVLAGVVALATIAYVIVASCTLSVIKSGSVDTRILAEAAKAQADVAKSQAEPLLHMSDWIGFFHLEQSKRMMVELKFQNDGKTNAAAISIAIKLE